VKEGVSPPLTKPRSPQLIERSGLKKEKTSGHVPCSRGTDVCALSKRKKKSARRRQSIGQTWQKLSSFRAGKEMTSNRNRRENPLNRWPAEKNKNRARTRRGVVNYGSIVTRKPLLTKRQEEKGEWSARDRTPLERAEIAQAGGGRGFRWQ